MLCCIEGDSEVAKLLLSSHANPDLQEKVLNVFGVYIFLRECGCVLCVRACVIRMFIYSTHLASTCCIFSEHWVHSSHVCL